MNLPVINVEQFTDIIEMQFNEGIQRPIFGLGKGGIGKTESIKSLTDKMGIGYIDIRLLMYSEVDLKGIPYPNEEHTKSIWLQNDILPNVGRDGEKGILVLDEITSVARSVRTAAYQLLNERKLGEYELPDGWMIVCIGNGEEDGGDFQGMEGNFANRCSIFNVVPNIDAWKNWAYSNDVNYLVLAYISWRPSDLHTFNPDKEEELLFASPRSWKAVSDILNKHPYDENNFLLNARIVSNLGRLVGNHFIAFCKYKKEVIEPSDILIGKDIKNVDSSMEVLFMTMQGVIKLMVDHIKLDVSNRGEIAADTITKCANGIKWILGLDSMEHRVMGIKDFAANDKGIITKLMLSKEFSSKCPELKEFAKENAAVFR